MKKLLLIVLSAGFLFPSFAQTTARSGDSSAVSHYNHLKVFSALFYPDKGNEMRSASGMPGPKYWQNRADYELHVTLDTASHRISGNVIITYTNNSPDNMDFLWLNLEQNANRADSRSKISEPFDQHALRNKLSTEGFKIISVGLVNDGGEEKAEYLITDTRLQIFLKNALQAAGGKIRIKIEYAFEIPVYGLNRMGRSATKNGWIYSIAQWYPRMAVYDDIAGWNTIPYYGLGEFYLDYGDIDYTIQAPSDLILTGTGELLNSTEVLSPGVISRLNKARESDRTILIRDSLDIAQNIHPKAASLRWHFSCKHTRDVAWAASRAYIWDAARIHLASGKKALAQSFYPVESTGTGGWARSTEFIKASIEYYSKTWYEYPYPEANAVASDMWGGMEYPGIVFNEMSFKNCELWEVTNHEFGHTLFPMIVGSNERKWGWMDEGVGFFINAIATEEFNHREFDSIENHRPPYPINSPDIDPAMNLPDAMQFSSFETSVYDMPALGFSILREEILGKKRFDFAFREYIKRWAYKHPTPWDFFHTMDNASGEDLSWFWNEWFFKKWKLDQAVREVSYTDSNYSKGALITLANLGEMALPVTLAIKEENGKTDTLRLPVEIWMKGGEYTFLYPSTSKIRYIELDPDHKLPDINTDNNIYSAYPVPAGMTVQKVVDAYFDAIGGKNKIRGIKNMVIESEGTDNGDPLIMDLQYQSSGFKKAKLFKPGNGRVVDEVVRDSTGVRSTRYGSDPMSRSLLIWYDPFPELDFEEKGFHAVLKPEKQMVNERLVYVITVSSAEGFKENYFYDSETGFKLKQILSSKSDEYIEFSDYRETSAGIKIPYKYQLPFGFFIYKLRVKSTSFSQE